MDKDLKTKDNIIFISTFDVFSKAHLKALTESTVNMNNNRGEEWSCHILGDKISYDLSNRFPQQGLVQRVDNFRSVKPILWEQLGVIDSIPVLEKLIQDNPDAMFIFFAGERNKMKSKIVRLMSKYKREFRFKGSI